MWFLIRYEVTTNLNHAIVDLIERAIQLTQAASRVGRQAVVLPQLLLPSFPLSVVWRTHHAERFASYFLPPYSPELDPIERGLVAYSKIELA